MTDEDVVRHVHAIAGGSLYGPRVRGQFKPMFVWQLTNWPDVLGLLAELLPYMGQRRRTKMEEVIAEAAADGRWKGTYKPCDLNLGISNKGYIWHQKRGLLPACDTCMASYRAYMARWQADHRDKTRGYEHAYRARKNAERRLKRQTQTSDGSASPPSEMAPT